MAESFSPPKTASEMALLADRCVQCGLCLPHCPTYQLDRCETESPRGRIAYIKALALGQIEASDKGDLHLDHCLGCRRCEAICPADVKYGHLLTLAREQQYLRKPPSFRIKAINGLLAKPRLLGIAGKVGRLAGELPALPSNIFAKPVAGPHANRNPDNQVAIFVGCIADAYENSTRANLHRLLNAIGFSVKPITEQTCCGTAALHLGDTETAKMLADQNRAAFGDKLTVLTLATGCHEHLSSSLQTLNVVIDALDFILQHAANLKFKTANKKIALHIPCSQSTVVKSDQSTRQLLSMIPELEIHLLPDRSCCGAAGFHMLTEPKRAELFRAPLIEDVLKSNACELLSANIGCRLHLANGLKIPVRHPIDFLAEHLA